MGLVFWWMLLVWPIAIALYWVVRYVLLHNWRFRRARSKAVPTAHSDRLTNLPEYKKAIKRYEVLVRTAAAALSVSLLVGIVLTARPQTISVITPAQKGRDIMLCLDVSGSLLRVDATIINRFTTLVSSFSGQRFGLTVFNSSSVSVIPLSDDYEFITSNLTTVGKALAAQKGQEFTDLTSGTLADFDKGTSLVSDGLTSCINNLGPNALKRSQSVILATDNQAVGKPIVSVKAAAALAETRNIRVYAIDPGIAEGADKIAHDDLRKLSEDTAGTYHLLSSNNAVSEIIDGISKLEAKYAASIPVVAFADKPTPFLYVTFIAVLISLGLLWRLRL